MPELATRLGTLSLPNPVLTAAGPSGFGRELAGYTDLAALGAVVTRSVTVAPRSGRATPRLAETPSGVLNSIGLQNDGVRQFVRSDLPWLAERGARVVVSIAGNTSDDYVAVARALYGQPAVAAVEVNISCPNLESRGQVFACDPSASSRVIGAVRRAADPQLPVFAKLSADVTDIVLIARACADAGADGFSLINTVLGVGIDLDTLGPALAGVTGGLSGPAIRPIALRCVWQVHRALPHLPIIGSGGVASGADALGFLLAGASAVAVGTATLGDPSAPARVLAQLGGELAARDLPSVAAVVGLAHRPADQRRPPVALAAAP